MGEIPAGELPTCGQLSADPGRLSGRRVGLHLLTGYLTPRINRLVTIGAGLSGTFDLDLEWDAAGAVPKLSLDGTAPPEFDDAPLIAALRQQLGLRLEAATGPVPVIVIESVQPPASD